MNGFSLWMSVNPITKYAKISGLRCPSVCSIILDIKLKLTIMHLITPILFLAATSVSMATVVEDFDSYSSGSGSDAFDPSSAGTWYKWNGVGTVTTNTVKIAGDSNGKHLGFGYNNPDGESRGAYRDLGSSYQIVDVEIGSFEFSFRVDSHSSANPNNNLYYGIGHDSAPTNGIDSFVAGINLVDDGSGDHLKLSAYNGDVMTPSSGSYDYDTWYHVALSIDRATDTYSVYVTENISGNYGNAILMGQRFNSDSDLGDDDTLSTFMVFENGISANSFARLDNVVYSNVLIPEVDNFALLIGLGLLAACITNRQLSVRP